MISVDNVSFGAKYSKTKNGNYYKKKNTGKRLGTMVGVAGGVCLSVLPHVQLGAYSAGISLCPKSPLKATAAANGIILAGIAAITLLCRAIGSIPDNIINKKRIAKADSNIKE